MQAELDVLDTVSVLLSVNVLSILISATFLFIIAFILFWVIYQD